MHQVILVNGVPASGKTWIAERIADELTAAYFSIDIVKEALFAHFGTGDRDYNRHLGRASYQSIFATISKFPTELLSIVDAWHGFQDKSVLKEHLTHSDAACCLEVWCHAPPEIIAERYRSRSSQRHAGHPPSSYADELHELASRATPMSFGPVLEVDTSQPVRIDELLVSVKQKIRNVS